MIKLDGLPQFHYGTNVWNVSLAGVLIPLLQDWCLNWPTARENGRLADAPRITRRFRRLQFGFDLSTPVRLTEEQNGRRDLLRSKVWFNEVFGSSGKPVQ